MVGFRPLRAPLFVPATRAERFHKAATCGADAIIIDLEDAVPAAAKDKARDDLAEFDIANLPVPVFLRINGRGTHWHELDLTIAATLPIAGIMLPKTECLGDLKHIAQRLSSNVPVIALVETAVGIAGLQQIATAPNLAQIAFGSVDFALDIGAQHQRDSLAFARAAIVLHARAARLPAPLDGVTIEIQDLQTLLSDSHHAAALGFGGKMAIHPTQVATIQSAFRPSEAQIAWAQRVIAAEKNANGAAIQLDGIMIDAPVCQRARQLLSAIA